MRDFGVEGPSAATTRYDLPLPNAHSVNVVTPLPQPGDIFTLYATERGVTPEALNILTHDQTGSPVLGRESAQ